MQLQSIARPFKKIGLQRGASILEAMGALAVGALIMAGVADQTNRYIDNTKDTYTAEHARLYAAAARAYVKANSTSIISATPVSVTASDIVKYLPVGFSADTKNPYGQTPKILLRNGVSGVEGYLIYEGGDVIPAGRRQFVSVMAGIGGGLVDDAGIPQGSGWSDSKYNETFGQVLSATVGRAVVSLNLLSPGDKQDCQHLSVDALTSGCGQYLNRNLDMVGYGIRVTSLAGVTSITADNTASNTINIIGAARFTDTVDIASSVTIGGELSATGAVSAEAFSPGLMAELATSCNDYRLGTIAQLSTTTAAEKGSLLSCQSPTASVTPATKTWLPLISASEQKSAVVACWVGNRYCELDPAVACQNRKDEKKSTDCGFNPASVTRDSRSVDGRKTDYYRAEIGESTFCALSFRAQTQSASDLNTPALEVSSGALPGTFCHVYSEVTGTSLKWYITAGSADRTPVACHATCMKGL